MTVLGERFALLVNPKLYSNETGLAFEDIGGCEIFP